MVENITHLAYFRAMNTLDMPQTETAARIFGEYTKFLEWGIGERHKHEDQSAVLADALKIDYDDETPPVLEGQVASGEAPALTPESSQPQQEEPSEPSST